MPTAIRTRSAPLDPICSEAVELARAAAVEEAGDPALVGEWLAVRSEGERLVAHVLRCANPAYRGWNWTVLVARASRSRQPTVAEVVLLPGEGALLAPPWVPWSERVQPGDLGVGDVMMTPPDDERLVPAQAGDDEEERAVAFELGLGRPRVLSPIGQDEAVRRWYAGGGGPDAAIARRAPARCGMCGFWLPVQGRLGILFGVCANEYAPNDAQVVSADHGCGAHSEALLPAEPVIRPDALVDEFGYDVIAAVPSPGTEDLGHS